MAATHEPASPPAPVGEPGSAPSRPTIRRPTRGGKWGPPPLGVVQEPRPPGCPRGRRWVTRRRIPHPLPASSPGRASFSRWMLRLSERNMKVLFVAALVVGPSSSCCCLDHPRPMRRRRAQSHRQGLASPLQTCLARPVLASSAQALAQLVTCVRSWFGVLGFGSAPPGLPTVASWYLGDPFLPSDRRMTRTSLDRPALTQHAQLGPGLQTLQIPPGAREMVKDRVCQIVSPFSS